MEREQSYRIRRIDGVISTDDIIPGRYKHMYSDPNELAKHVFENCAPGLAATFENGDALWCCSTFGIGSSREQAATSLFAAGVRLVLAPRFGRIFYRNAWNTGLRVLELAPPDGNIEGQRLRVDWQSGHLSCAATSTEFETPPPRLLEISRAGGLLKWVLRDRIPSTPQRAGATR